MTLITHILTLSNNDKYDTLTDVILLLATMYQQVLPINPTYSSCHIAVGGNT